MTISMMSHLLKKTNILTILIKKMETMMKETNQSSLMMMTSVLTLGRKSLLLLEIRGTPLTSHRCHLGIGATVDDRSVSPGLAPKAAAFTAGFMR